MRNVWIVFKTLVKDWLRSPTGVFFSFLFPVLLLLIFGTLFGGTENTRYALYIQNLDVDESGNQTNLSTAFIEAIKSTECFDIKPLDKDVNISAFVKNQQTIETLRFLVIPDGFEEKAINKTVVVRMGIIVDTLVYVINNYSQYMNASDIANITMGKEMLSAYLNQTNATSPEVLLIADEHAQSTQIIKGIIYSVSNGFNNQLTGASDIVIPKSEDLQQRRWRAADYYLPGYIAAFIMTNGIIGMTTTVTEYKRNGIVKRLSATPLSKRDWILGCILQQTFLGFALTLLMIGFSWAIFGVRAIPDLYAVSLIFIGCVLFSSIGMTLGGFVKDIEAANGIGNAIGFPLMFLSGAFWPVEVMPSYMQTIAKGSPVYYFHQGLREIMIYSEPANATISFVVLTVLAVIFTLLAIKITRWKDL
ncbi:MAG: ABC transporter permease [Thermoplasmata archaeon]|nr:ABC transporter permease [Thermoplasmata archaeon]